MDAENIYGADNSGYARLVAVEVMPLNRVKFMNTHIDNISFADVLEYCSICVRNKVSCHIITLNTDQIIRIERDRYFAKIVKHAGLVLPDGMPLIWIAKLYGRPFKEKVSGSDLMPELCRMAANEGQSIFLLGAMPGVAARAADN
jgi:N-acetylglucosaminyldiphosphoundecaprenol N-acetyl-beta-D-mannosaminyltransferase